MTAEPIPTAIMLSYNNFLVEVEDVAETVRPFNPIFLPRPFLVAHALNAAGSRE